MIRCRRRGGKGARARPSELPAVVGGAYEIGPELARGGMGRIVAAHDVRLGRDVALKQLVRNDEELRARFEREALITARLQHPAIVPVYEAGRLDDGEPFYSMRLVAGRSLDKVLSERTDLNGRLALLPHMIAVIDALAYAHAQRVIHRDLKPANVLVGDFGETVVIDWGLAKDLNEGLAADAGPYRRAGSALETAYGSVMGTPGYMSPEQANGDAVDERTDVYALGAT